MAEQRVYTLGLSKIEIGDIAQDGGMGSTLSQMGYTYKDTCTLTSEDPEKTEHYVEEVDDPVVVLSKAGKTTIDFSLANPSPETLVALAGGTASASVSGGEKDIWEAPDSLPTIEKSIKLTPKQGYIIEIPRGNITAKMDGNLNQGDLFMLKVNIVVMKPTKSGEAKWKLTKIAAS